MITSQSVQHSGSKSTHQGHHAPCGPPGAKRRESKSRTGERLRIDCESRRVFIGDREINLTAKEFDVLELLVFNPNKVYSRENLLNIVWGYEYPATCAP